MNGKYLLEKMDLIDPEFIENADKKPRKAPIMWKQWVGLAACLLLAMVSGLFLVLSPEAPTVITQSPGETASLFTSGNIPLIGLIVSGLAAGGVTAIIIKKRSGKDKQDKK